MSDKALTNAELELTQRMQMHFPRGLLSADKLRQWNSCPRAILAKHLAEMLQVDPSELDQHFPVWKLIQLASDTDVPGDPSNAYRRNGILVSNGTVALLDKVPVARTVPAGTEWNLVKVSVAELGYRRVSRSELYRHAQEDLGWELYSVEAALFLRKHYVEQTIGEWLNIGMVPIVDSMGRPQILCAGHSKYGLRLRTQYAGDERVWDSDSLWTFVRRPNGN